MQYDTKMNKNKIQTTQNASLQCGRTNMILKPILDKQAENMIRNNSVQGVAYESYIELHLPLINADFRSHNSLTVVESSTNIHDVN